MEKLTIYQVLNCNRTLYRLFKQGKLIPANIGFKIHHIMKVFDEVEEYVLHLMRVTFEDFDLGNFTDEQTLFYNNLLSSEVELDYERLDRSFFENNDNLFITLEDVDNLGVILE